MNRTQNPIKLVPSHNKNLPNQQQHVSLSKSATNQNKIVQLQLLLKQSNSQVQFLKSCNQQLREKVAYYETKCQDLSIMQQQLQFRREQEHHIQQHLDNYQQINAKLRDKINQLQSMLRIKNQNISYQNMTGNKLGSRSTSACFQQSYEMSQKMSRNSNAQSSQNSKIQLNRKSISDIQKQNHPLTPKNRVSINFQKFMKNQNNPIHQIKERRKVFL